MLVFWQAAPCVASGGASMASLALASRPTNALQLCAACTDMLGLHDVLLWWKCTTCYYGDDSQRDDALHVAMVRNVAMESMRATYCGDRTRRVANRSMLLWR